MIEIHRRSQNRKTAVPQVGKHLYAVHNTTGTTVHEKITSAYTRTYVCRIHCTEHWNVKAGVSLTVVGLSFCSASDLSIIWIEDGFSANTKVENQVMESRNCSLWKLCIKFFRFTAFLHAVRNCFPYLQNCGAQWKQIATSKPTVQFI